ncbi:hypothetical protein CW705_02815 [Candidatus Bathyarchaeota archaeon]|nr:MAG: hypothetical protein CW705_02815 [Candidatus Bathyarchaeota archaeon]
MAFIVNENVPVIPPEDPNVTNYLLTVTNSSRFELAQRFKKSYLPLVQLPRERKEANKILQRIYEMHNDGRDCGGENAFKYLIGEIVDNIYEHSEFETSWVMAQAYGSMGFMDICFFDDGITINGCFKKHGMGFKNDCQAIVEAINGASTKGDQRGFGLNTTMRIFTHGIKGQMLIVSGRGCVMFSKTKQQPYDLGKAYQLEGTLVSVRIPYPSPEVDIYAYLEGN